MRLAADVMPRSPRIVDARRRSEHRRLRNAELIRTPAPAGGLESDVADIPSLQQKAVDFAKRGDFGADARALNE